jgi:hypothetical protein
MEVRPFSPSTCKLPPLLPPLLPLLPLLVLALKLIVPDLCRRPLPEFARDAGTANIK